MVFCVDNQGRFLIRGNMINFSGGRMHRIDVHDERINGAWLIRKAEKLGIPIHAPSSKRDLARRRKQELANAVAELDRFFDPLAPSSITSHRKILGPGIIFTKKALRKVLKPLFSAVINTQRIFNSKLSEWIHLQQKWDQQTEKRLSMLEKMARDLNHRITEIEKTQRLSEKSGAGRIDVGGDQS